VLQAVQRLEAQLSDIQGILLTEDDLNADSVRRLRNNVRVALEIATVMRLRLEMQSAQRPDSVSSGTKFRHLRP
jgi:hypothetical protein